MTGTSKKAEAASLMDVTVSAEESKEEVTTLEAAKAVPVGLTRQGGTKWPAVSFGRLGQVVGGKWKWAFILAVLAVDAGLASGLFGENLINTELFESLLQRPGTRLQRETDQWKSKEDDAYITKNEASNARATRGGKSVLTRKNMVQAYRFWRDADVTNMEIDNKGVTYTSPDVFRYLGAQPFRYSLLDCWQEGAYDYLGVDLAELGASLLTTVADQALEPFYRVAGQRPVITPYNWCLYARLTIVYAPASVMDPHVFGRCRQFSDPELSAEHAALDRAYDFHRFLAFDQVKASPSESYTWGCRRPFRDEAPGRCHPVLTCCELSRVYSQCAKCELDGVASSECPVDVSHETPPGSNSTTGNSTTMMGESESSSSSYSLLSAMLNAAETCDVAADLLGVDDWAANSLYDAEYASKKECAAFDFQPISTLYGVILSPSAPAAVAESLSLDDCQMRSEYYAESEADRVHAAVDLAVNTVYCELTPGVNLCPTLDSVDTDWRFEDVNLATDADLGATGTSGTCAFWDGGPDGLGLLPYINLDITLSDKTTKAKALQVVHVSQGYKVIRNTLEAREGVSIKTKDAEEGRAQFLIKFGKTVHGRHRGGSMKFGTYLSDDSRDAVIRASSPETYLILLAYCLIFVYAVTIIGVVTAAPSNCVEAGLHAGLAVTGLTCVFFGLVAGTGFSLLITIKLNALCVQVLPFLLLGLGINDCFVISYCYLKQLKLTRQFSARVQDHLDVVVPELIANVMADAGATTTLTTFSNFFVFLVTAAVVKMRLISSFSIMAACGLIGTWFNLVILFTALLSFHARKTLSLPKPRIQSTDAKASCGRKVARARYYGVEAYVHGLTSHTACRVAVMVCTATAICVMAALGVPEISLDFPIYSLFPKRSSPAEFWITKREHLKVNFFELKTGKFDYPRKHPLLAGVADRSRYSLLGEIEAAKKTNTDQTFWYELFVQFMLPCGQGSFADTTLTDAQVREKCAESAWYGAYGLGAYNSRCSATDVATTPPGNCGPKLLGDSVYLDDDRFLLASTKKELHADPNGTEPLRTAATPACTAWPVQYFTCDGAPCFGPDELTQDLYDQVVAGETVVLGLHPDFYYDCFNAFLQSDAAVTLTSPRFSCHDPASPSDRLACSAVPQSERFVYRGKTGLDDMDYSSGTVWAQDLKKGVDWLDLFPSVRRKLNNFVKATGVDAYPGSDFWIFWYQFRFMEDAIITSFAWAVSGVFVLVYAFFFLAQEKPGDDGDAGEQHSGKNSGASFADRQLEALWLAFLTMLAICILCLMFLSSLGLAGLNVNAFSVATVILSFGFAVEFIAHTSFGFLRAKGTAPQRANAAMMVYILPIFDGAFTTFLGFAPLAASPITYIVLYYFQIYAMLVAIGLFVGIVFFPCLLATFGRSNGVADGTGAERASSMKDLLRALSSGDVIV